MAEAYKTIRQEGLDEFTVSRSRFIGCAAPITSEEDALALIDKVGKTYRDASHHVWAYTLGADRERCSDDGEPRGTAGLPVLEVIRKEGLRNVAVVVTRYFGGIKLGAGGLIRAYTHGAAIALEAGEIIERRPFLVCDVRVEYAAADRLRRELERRGYLLREPVYADRVTVTVLVPPDEEEALSALVADLTAGRGVMLAGPIKYQDIS